MVFTLWSCQNSNQGIVVFISHILPISRSGSGKSGTKKGVNVTLDLVATAYQLAFSLRVYPKQIIHFS
jgi:hypothetical protein